MRKSRALFSILSRCFWMTRRFALPVAIISVFLIHPSGLRADLCPIQSYSFQSSLFSSILPAAGGTGQITINTQANCQWTITSDFPWVTLTNASGIGTGTFDVAIIPNAGPFRGAVLSLNGFQILPPINQSAGGCQVKVAPQSFGQGNPEWATQTYNNYNDAVCQSNPNAACRIGDASSCCRIQRLGCAVTTLAMALSSASVASINGKDLTPASLNSFMRLPNQYFDDDHNVKFDATAGAVSGGRLKLNTPDADERSTDALQEGLCKGYPVIAGVDLTTDQDTGETIPGHYVLVTAKNDDNFSIIDPGDSTNIVLNTADFVARGYIADPAGDVSRLDVTIGTNAEVMLIDTDGRRTGFDAPSHSVKKEIPNSSHFIDSLRDDETKQLAPTRSHSVRVFQPAQGIYQVVIPGLRLGTYTLSVDQFAQDGTHPQPTVTNGVASPGSTSTFQIEFVPSSHLPLMIVRVATFQSTLADITNSLQLGLIDSTGIANSLSQKIESAQTATGPAKNNILNAVENELNAQSGKHVGGVAVQVLVQDVDSLISQNQ